MQEAQSIIGKRKERWRKLHDPKSGQRRVFMIYCSEDQWPASPPPYPEYTAGRAESAIETCRLQKKRIEWLDDDSIPFVNVYAPTHVFASAFGCELVINESSGRWIKHRITKASEVSALKVPDLSHPVLAALFEIAEEARRQLGPDTLLKLPDIQSPMDIAAQIWEKTEFYYGIADAPEAVKELASKCRELLTAFGDEWFRRFGTEFIAHYPDYYMPRGLTLSEDEIGTVSTEMFDEFFKPHLEALAKHFGGLGMHCCAHARHQWPNLRKLPGLKVLNLTQPSDVTADAYRFFEKDFIHVHDIFPVDKGYLEWFDKEVPNARIVVRPYVKTRVEAIELAGRMRDWARKESNAQ